jgi:hypothetical protein
MKYLPRDAAAGKLRSMVAAARTLRAEHGSDGAPGSTVA